VGVGLVFVAIVGLLIGVLLGLPGRYEQTAEDIERLMAEGGRPREKRAKRQLSPMAWLQRKVSPRSPPPKRRRTFKLEAPGAPGDSGPGGRRGAVARDVERPSAAEATGGRDNPRAKPRSRAELRQGRFKLRPPGEGDR
jgi:hypothetical protein